ncbi:hypothetical protein TNCV_2391461 [Trichonephila clavipes]|nr:hypothetical protein TNCV_2391461 [Trichonephila clavipes]
MVNGYLYLLIDAKPAFFLNTEDLQLPQTKNETPATVEPNATASTPATVESDPTASTPTQPSTRSGRKVHLPTSRSFEHHTGDDLARFHPNFEGEYPGGGQGPPTSLPLPTSREDFRRFKVPPCREGTIHLQATMSSPGFEPSPNGTEVSVANHYTGWVTKK